MAWENAGVIAIKDSETGKRLWLDSGNRRVMATIVEHAKKKKEALVKLSKKGGFDFMTLTTQESVVDGLAAVFRRREKRRRRS